MSDGQHPGPGLDQGTARKKAKEMGGLAVSARRGSTGEWVTGGWPEAKDVWIVVSLDGRAVLDDGSNPGPPEVPYDRIIRRVAERLNMTVEDVDRVMDTYEEESMAEAQRRRQERKNRAD